MSVEYVFQDRFIEFGVSDLHVEFVTQILHVEFVSSDFACRVCVPKFCMSSLVSEICVYRVWCLFCIPSLFTILSYRVCQVSSKFRFIFPSFVPLKARQPRLSLRQQSLIVNRVRLFMLQPRRSSAEFSLNVFTLLYFLVVLHFMFIKSSLILKPFS